MFHLVPPWILRVGSRPSIRNLVLLFSSCLVSREISMINYLLYSKCLSQVLTDI